MSRTSPTLTNTDLAFLLCTLATTSPHSQSQSQFPKVTLSFETNYGLLLSLEPDGSITISLRTPHTSTSTPMSTDSLDPFGSATPIQSQQQLFTTAPVSRGHGSIDGVLLSSPLRGAFGMMTTGTGGASITPARSTPSTSTSRLGPVLATMTQASKQRSSQQDILMAANKAGISNSSNMKIRYYIRPSGLDANSSSSSHMYYTASASASASTKRQTPHDPASNNTKRRPRTRALHRVKLSHLQSLYHTHLPSSTGTPTSRKSTSSSWFDAYLDWIDRLDDAIALSRQRAAGQQQTPIAALPPGTKIIPLQTQENDPSG
ncbi:hypothetical protein NCU05834 [Neurospora crassa OR74A]|uniref:Uncharacterized protein n=1 Tax=Neurospora crassa (strain ATCC 24698 / 74-OR23-1A / CBS 708.71 / DSM 1257 / FGSC 987) TaxID=367110 RepID=Q7S5K9_NEUCR|nr:hypothetical protein NCU05834 [Neurospora crassa OR74A]EAA30858.3 hypothetical protein NCU05834 [Neurospora crassa OR74A]|eukprot:XP_960094.3 hypothetical protein NCU05834 [Neurospora crassa OR74A]